MNTPNDKENQEAITQRRNLLLAVVVAVAVLLSILWNVYSVISIIKWFTIGSGAADAF
jgi:hypothetical protein